MWIKASEINLREDEAAIIFKGDTGEIAVLMNPESEYSLSSPGQTLALTLAMLIMENDPRLGELIESKNKEVAEEVGEVCAQCNKCKEDNTVH